MKKLKVSLFIFIFMLSFSTVISAYQITGTKNDSYRKSLEKKYGCEIIIDNSVTPNDSFYKEPRIVKDVELQILKDIESAFTLLPEGFVKEVNDFFKNQGSSPKLFIKIRTENDLEANGWFSYQFKHISEIYIVEPGNCFIETIIHEFGHAVETVLQYKNIIAATDLEKYFKTQNKNFPYNKNYKRLYDTTLTNDFYDIYINEYSSSSYAEDFAETFTHGITQYRYISSYGKGKIKPIHNKIKKVSEVLDKNFKSVKNTDFLLNCMPDSPPSWSAGTIKKAKENGIIKWDIYGLNTMPLTKYDAALILQPFLFEYVEKDILYKKAGVKENYTIADNFVYDIADPDDIYLLINLKIMDLTDGRFNPNQKIQKQSAALILTKVAQILGIHDKDPKEYKYNDAKDIDSWAKSYVKFVTSLKIMGPDDKNNFNPKNYITYNTFYNSLVNLNNLKKSYNKANNINLPENTYYQLIGDGTALSSDGWIYYNSYMSNTFNGNGKVTQNDGTILEGEFKDGNLNGRGKVIWNDGDVYEGMFKDNKLNGKGKVTLSGGTVFEGDFKDNSLNGKGKVTLSSGTVFEGDFKDSNLNGKGKITWYDGDVYEGEFKDDKLNGKGKITQNDGTILEGEFKDGKLNGKGKIIWNDGDVEEGTFIDNILYD